MKNATQQTGLIPSAGLPTASRPVAVSFAAHDPTAGAGLPADLAAFAALGCQPAGILTGVTAQDTCGVHHLQAFSPDWIEKQAFALLNDMPPAVFKTGALCTTGIVEAVADIARRYPDVPLVADPVLASGRGDALGEKGLAAALVRSLLPLVTVLTPNVPEALALSGQPDVRSAVDWLLAAGARSVLLTGTHDESTGADVVNMLYTAEKGVLSHRCLRLPGHYHGSGCTLASSLAACIAQGLTLPAAVECALRYTWEALNRADRPGKCQAIPDRQLGRYWNTGDFAGNG